MYCSTLPSITSAVGPQMACWVKVNKQWPTLFLNAPLTVFAGDDFLQAGYDFPSSATQQEFINLLFFHHFRKIENVENQ